MRTRRIHRDPCMVSVLQVRLLQSSADVMLAATGSASNAHGNAEHGMPIGRLGTVEYYPSCSVLRWEASAARSTLDNERLRRPASIR